MKSLHNLRIEPLAPAGWAELSAPASEQIGDELKVIFGGLTASPMPDRMLQLAQALEEAFHRGELFESNRPRAV